MKIVTESPEHHFLAALDALRQDAAGWIGLHFPLSSRLDHAGLVESPDHIKGKLTKLRREAETLSATLKEKAAAMPGATIHLFTDGDIVFMARPENAVEHTALKALQKEMTALVGDGLCRAADLTREIYEYQKLADKRILGARRLSAYEALADGPRVQSIQLRRGRRDTALALIVEDDRFTASYAANILNKDYDVVHARNGEEAIISYIEHAPDITFLDIHLPGLDGIETLHALRRIDSEAFVVMLSVDTVKDNILNATKEGAFGFLKKPFSKDRLLSMMKQSPFVKKREGKASSTTRS